MLKIIFRLQKYDGWWIAIYVELFCTMYTVIWVTKQLVDELFKHPMEKYLWNIVLEHSIVKVKNPATDSSKYPRLIYIRPSDCLEKCLCVRVHLGRLCCVDRASCV